MRSRTSGIVSDRQVQSLAEQWLREALPLKTRGWKCTAQVLWQVVLLAATRMVSLFAACRDLINAPSDDAVREALVKCLPKRPRTLEEYLAPALAGQQLPKALFARGREVAIDWHLIPYHGEPHKHAHELYHSKPKSGTTKFHAYATACVVENSGTHWRRHTSKETSRWWTCSNACCCVLASGDCSSKRCSWTGSFSRWTCWSICNPA